MEEGDQLVKVAKAWKASDPDKSQTDMVIFNRIIDRDFDGSGISGVNTQLIPESEILDLDEFISAIEAVNSQSKVNTNFK